MSLIYQRNIGKRKSRDLRRMLIATLLVLAASAAWFILRPSVIRRAARLSIGGPDRSGILGAAVHQARGNVLGRMLAGTGPSTYSVPAPGGFVWRESVTGENGTVISSRFVIADHRFREIGSVRSPRAFWLRVGDFNGDEKPDVLCMNWHPPLRVLGRQFEVLPVIHLRGDRNRISGIVLIDWAAVAPPSTYVQVVWLDADNDGVQELVVRSVSFTKRPKGKFTITAVADVALFEWTAPDGVLKARRMPNDGTVAFWAPPDGRPYSFPADRSIDDVLNELIPNPAKLFPPPVTQPASPPASAPAANKNQNGDRP